MKNIFTLLLVIFSYLNLFSQSNFAPIGSKWIYSYGAVGGGGYEKYESMGDTTIGGLATRKIRVARLSIRGNFRDTFWTYLQVRNDSVYQLNGSNSQFLLFLKPKLNDTLKFRSTSNTFYVVKKVDTINIGQNVKRFRMAQYCNNRESPFFDYVENIGLLNDPIVILDLCHALKDVGYTLCYFESGILSYGNKTECEKLVSTKDLLLESEVLISPTVAADYISINSVYDFKHYSIYDINGKNLKNGSITGLSQEHREGVQLNVSSLSKGFYLLQLSDNKEKRVVKKFIKN
jgi:Secretion system C-terminal sorting domain